MKEEISVNNYDLEEGLENLRKRKKTCWDCGVCMSFCPVYRETSRESSLARGKNAMIRALLKGELEITNEFAERMNECLLCKTCTVNCPSETEIPSIVVEMRSAIVKAKGLPFAKWLVFRGLMKNRKLFGNVVKLASKFQWLFMPKAKGQTRHLPFFLSALGKNRRIPPIAKKFLRDQVPEINRPPEGMPTKLRVGLFIGCATEFILPHVGKATVDFLTKNGVEVIIPREQSCCGAPMYLGSGDFKTGREMADTNVKAFKDVDTVITPCATCGSAIKDYAKFLADTPERLEAYTKFRDKIKDISEFLVDDLKLPATADNTLPEAQRLKVTWHDPCHLNRYQGVTRQPREIINTIPDMELVEMPNADRCCGMAGTFSVYYYDTSQKIADKKLDSIVASGADIVATACPGCMIQLMDGISRRKMPQRVLHIMELLAYSKGNYDKSRR